MGLRDGAIELGFRMFGATGLHRAAQKFTQGLGAILMLHRVCAPRADAFQPNRGLEIAPDFLDLALTRARAAGYDFVSLDEALARIRSGESECPFLALTFDDGYRDTADVALPILARHGAPFTVYVTTGFADRSARLWWVEMERAIAALERVRLDIDGVAFDLPARTSEEKQAAFRAIYWPLRRGPEPRLLAAAAELCRMAGVDCGAIAAELCLDFDHLRALSRHPLATLGAHTLSHPMLAKLDIESARAEIAQSRLRLQSELGLPIDHFAYPVGDPASAGAREFQLAREAGFASAVTTRPGMIFPEHADYLTALPRLSVNGNHQSLATLDILLSGAPFMLWNRGRKLSVA